MTVLYPNMCYNVVCYKGTALFTHLWASTRENLPRDSRTTNAQTSLRICPD